MSDQDRFARGESTEAPLPERIANRFRGYWRYLLNEGRVGVNVGVFLILSVLLIATLIITIFRVQPVVAQQPVRTRVTDESDKPQGAVDGGGNGASAKKSRKIGVNDPCPCGSGKKYKYCHGAPAKKSLV